jgi:uncharacterized membrane protein
MGFRIVNHHSQQITVAIMYASPQSCSGAGRDWATEGWWNIAPGGSALVYGGDMNFNRNWYYHAHANDGTLWDGPIKASLPNAGFKSCLGTSASPGTNRGFRQIDTGNVQNYTLTLNGPGGPSGGGGGQRID